MKQPTTTLLALLSALTLISTPAVGQAETQEPTPRGPATGLIVGVNFTGSFVTVDDAVFDERTFGDRGRESGGGMHFTLGYAFTPSIGVLLHGGGVELSEDEERNLGGVELALRYSFAKPAQVVVPYLEMAVGGFALEDGFEGGGSELTGRSLAVAAGFNLFVTRRVALNADFRYNMGMFTKVSLGSQSIADDARMGFSTSRLNVGFNWYPMAGR